jgi:hypothetical protein
MVLCIRNGQAAFLWLNYWLLDGRRSSDLLPYRTLSSARLPWNAKVSDIIKGDRWKFPISYQNI